MKELSKKYNKIIVNRCNNKVKGMWTVIRKKKPNNLIDLPSPGELNHFFVSIGEKINNITSV